MVNIAGLEPLNATERIARAGVHVAVNLNGHTKSVPACCYSVALHLYWKRNLV